LWISGIYTDISKLRLHILDGKRGINILLQLKMLRRIFGARRDDVTWEGIYIMRCLMNCTTQTIFLG